MFSSSTRYLIWLRPDNDLYNSLWGFRNRCCRYVKNREKSRWNKGPNEWCEICVYIWIIYITPVITRGGLHHISNYYTLINDARVTPQTFANETTIEAGKTSIMLIGTSAIRQHADAAEKKERKKKGTSVALTSRTIWWTSTIAAAAYSVRSLSEAGSPREWHQSDIIARDRNVNPPLGRARDDLLASTMAGARRGYN